MTDSLDAFFGRNVSYDQNHVEIYDKLLEETISPFYENTMADIFVYAAIYGYLDGSRDELKKGRPNISAVAMTTSQKSALLAIAINTEGLDVLFEKDKAIRIIEEFANAGIKRLEPELVKVHADPITTMASMMKKIARERSSAS